MYAKDHGTPVLETSVDVTVTVDGKSGGGSSSDAGVAFSRNGYVFSVREGVAVGSQVGQVNAEGPSGLSYRIRTPTETFVIDSSSGKVLKSFSIHE